MALDVKVKIDLTKPVGKSQYWYPLIFIDDTDVEYKEYATFQEIAADYENTTKVYKAASLMYSQSNPPSRVAICGAKSDAANKINSVAQYGWRWIIRVSEGEATADIDKTIATAIETTNKMFFAVTTIENVATFAGKVRTVVFVHSDELAAAALAGEVAGNDPGSINYKNLILAGIEPMDYSDSEIETIHDAHAITFVTKAGDNVTSEGTTMSGEYIDIVDIQDYVIHALQYNTQKLLNASKKIPMDNNGIALLESVAVDVMKDCDNKGMIAHEMNDDGSVGAALYTVSYALRDQIPDADRVARKYTGGQFSFTAAGAINYVEITGEIII